MKQTITARHCDVPEAARERASLVMDRLGRLSRRALEGTVVFDESSQLATVELRLHVRGGRVLVGLAEGKDHRTALDRAEAKVRRQLDRTSTQALKGRRPSRAA